MFNKIKFEYGSDGQYVDVTNKVYELFVNPDRTLRIPENIIYNFHFSDPCMLKNKHLKITIPDCKKLLYIKENTQFQINLPLLSDNKIQFEYGIENHYINVTNKIYNSFLDDIGNIIIPSNVSYNNHFSDPYPEKTKHLKVKLYNNDQSIYIKEDTPFQISMSMISQPLPDIICVYFINCYISPLYFALFELQFKHIRGIGLLPRCKNIYIEASIHSSKKAQFIDDVHRLVPRAIINCNERNIHEYPGIHKVWQLSQLSQNNSLDENTIILYFHSKGITRIKYPLKRDAIEENIAQIVLCPYKTVLPWFNILTDVMKCGYSGSLHGCIWHNYWFAKVKYLRECIKPIITTDRYYYEHWLDNCQNATMRTNRNCFGLVLDTNRGAYNLGSYYDPNTNRYF